MDSLKEYEVKRRHLPESSAQLMLAFSTGTLVTVVSHFSAMSDGAT